MTRAFAIVTGASSGIGLELAAVCAQEGFDLLVAADRPEIRDAADRFRLLGANVTVVEADLATMLDTKVGQAEKDDPADVARVGFDAMMRGDGDVVSGWKNKVQTVIANVTPAGVLAERHRKMAEPGRPRRRMPEVRLAGGNATSVLTHAKPI